MPMPNYSTSLKIAENVLGTAHDNLSPGPPARRAPPDRLPSPAGFDLGVERRKTSQALFNLETLQRSLLQAFAAFHLDIEMEIRNVLRAPARLRLGHSVADALFTHC